MPWSFVEGLEPASSIEYRVTLDGELRWPAPTVRCRRAESARSAETRRCKIVFGSCRTAAPHDAPWSLELALDSRGRGVDALHVYAMWMVDHPQEEWPALAVFLGDQVYADDSSPKTRERIAVARKSLDHSIRRKGCHPSSSTVSRNTRGCIRSRGRSSSSSGSSPTCRRVMIFDDHEMIDDWNISDTWVREIRRDALVAGPRDRWVDDLLAVPAPRQPESRRVIRSEGLLDALGRGRRRREAVARLGDAGRGVHSGRRQVPLQRRA